MEIKLVSGKQEPLLVIKHEDRSITTIYDWSGEDSEKRFITIPREGVIIGGYLVGICNNQLEIGNE